MVKPVSKIPENKPDELVPYLKSSSPFYITSKFEKRKILKAEKGIGSDEPTTLISLLEQVVAQQKDKVAYSIEWPEPSLLEENQVPPPTPLDSWKQWTYKDTLYDVKRAAKSLISLGFKSRDTCSLYGFNNPCWVFGSLGAICAGGIFNGMYSTDSIKQLIYKSKVSGTTIVIVEEEKHLKNFVQVSKEYSGLKSIIVWKEVKELNKYRKKNSTLTILTWEEFLSKGEQVNEEQLIERIDNINPEECCVLVFTSGTTGNPKAVMLSHDNITTQIKGSTQLVGKTALSKPVRIISYLPMSHIAAFTMDILSVISIPLASNKPCTVYFCRSYDLKYGSLLARLKQVKPTIFFAVPRVWEKFHEAIIAKAPKSGPTSKVSKWAKNKVLKSQKNKQLGKTGKNPLFISFAKYIMRAARKKIGFENVAFAASGAAVLKKDTFEFWASLGIYICEAYGMSECSGTATTTTNIYRQWGTVGPAIKGTEVKILKPFEENKQECEKVPSIIFEKAYSSTASIPEKYHGEICYRGRHIMLGYCANPDLGIEHVKELEKKNSETIDKEGWLHSGDKGVISEKGMLKITGRYKELIIGAGGENIAPIPIEDDFKAKCSALSNVVMIGDGRKFNVALVTLKCVGATGEKPGTNELAPGAVDYGSSGVKTVEEACNSGKFIKEVEKALEKTNSNGDVIINNTFKIQKFTILPLDLSVETGDFTVTQKLKRSVVTEKYKDVIEKMYQSKEGNK
eukprot:snap_masked-scaffold_18-processed-gene-6.31-mRNA-1 protein AED:0.02 eAED:0.03 QI:0/0/0/0.75/1/1/4/0/737